MRTLEQGKIGDKMVLSILETFELSYIANVLYLSTLKPFQIELYYLQTPSSRPSSSFPPKYSFHFMQLSQSLLALPYPHIPIHFLLISSICICLPLPARHCLRCVWGWLASSGSQVHGSQICGWPIWIVLGREGGNGGGVRSAEIKWVLPAKLTKITRLLSDLINIQQKQSVVDGVRHFKQPNSQIPTPFSPFGPPTPFP